MCSGIITPLVEIVWFTRPGMDIEVNRNTIIRTTQHFSSKPQRKIQFLLGEPGGKWWKSSNFYHASNLPPNNEATSKMSKVMRMIKNSRRHVENRESAMGNRCDFNTSERLNFSKNRTICRMIMGVYNCGAVALNNSKKCT